MQVNSKLTLFPAWFPHESDESHRTFRKYRTNLRRPFCTADFERTTLDSLPVEAEPDSRTKIQMNLL